MGQLSTHDLIKIQHLSNFGDKVMMKDRLGQIIISASIHALVNRFRVTAR
jgi:hypothetical protein